MVYDYLVGCGYGLVPREFYGRIEKWNGWYKGKVRDFHSYSVFNGVNRIRQERRSLSMAKKVCEDRADLLLNEKVKFNFAREDLSKFVEGVLEDNNFYVRANQLMEVVGALGTGAFVEYLRDGEVIVDTVMASQIFPTRWENGRVIDCCFVSRVVYEGKKYVYLNEHKMEETGYVIYNKFLEEKGGKLVEVLIPYGMGIADRFETGGEVAYFQIVTPSLVNNVDYDVPMGISIFSGAIDVLKSIDIIYDSMINEFVLGKKRIFVKDNLLKYKPNNGKIEPMFDVNDVVFNWWGDDDDGKSEIREIDLSLRIEEHERGLRHNLQLLSGLCGFGNGYYNFEGSGVRTATEVVSENAQMFRAIRKDEILLKKVLLDMVKAIVELGKKAGRVGKGVLLLAGDVRVEFDDGIIEDSRVLQARALEEFREGLIDEVEYYVRVWGFTQEQGEIYLEGLRGRREREENFEVEKVL